MFMCARGFEHHWGEIMFKHFGTSGSCTVIYFSYDDTHEPERLTHTNSTKCLQKHIRVYPLKTVSSSVIFSFSGAEIVSIYK